MEAMTEMEPGALGKEYADQEQICCQGDRGDWMYVMQAGRAVVVHEDADTEVVVGELTPGDVFGEMAIFDRQPRSASVRAMGKARVMTLDKRAFLRRVHEDPTLAFRILQKMSLRVRSLNDEVMRLKRSQA
jgi:CRP-like cAMP-binding protein